MKNIILSVIIPTRNRANLLKRALESIAKQNLSQEYFEIIVVDNGSIDNTRKIVDSFGKKISNIRYFYESTPGLHVGRHKGLKEAKADILVYIDDDIEAFPTWLEGIVDAFENKDVGLVGGKNLPKFETQPPNWIDKLWLKNKFGKMIPSFSLLDFGDKICEIPHNYIWGCNYSIRKEALIYAGGFHPDGMPEHLLKYRGDGENALSRKVKQNGWKAIYHPSASVYHLVPLERMTMQYIYRRSFSQGISCSYTWVRKHMRIDFILRLIILQKRIRSFASLSVKKDARCTMHKGFWDGVTFHQRALRLDPVLLNWVLKKTYLDVL